MGNAGDTHTHTQSYKIDLAIFTTKSNYRLVRHFATTFVSRAQERPAWQNIGYLLFRAKTLENLGNLK